MSLIQRMPGKPTNTYQWTPGAFVCVRRQCGSRSASDVSSLQIINNQYPLLVLTNLLFFCTERGPSPNLNINLNSNNPFRRAASPIPSPVKSDNTDTRSKHMSRNPFLDPSTAPAKPLSPPDAAVSKMADDIFVSTCTLLSLHSYRPTACKGRKSTVGGA